MYGLRICSALFLLCLCLGMKPASPVNVSSWAVSLDKDNAVATSQKQNHGDVITLKAKQLKDRKMLTVSYYFCGSQSDGGFANIILKDENGNTIDSSASQLQKGLSYLADIPLEKLTGSEPFKKGNAVQVWFNVRNENEGTIPPFLLLRLQRGN